MTKYILKSTSLEDICNTRAALGLLVLSLLCLFVALTIPTFQTVTKQSYFTVDIGSWFLINSAESEILTLLVNKICVCYS